ncbi:SDR family oxidoreductase [Scytonema sp. NUACC26]|uniref:SDR family oxidoreductase n=1 Tax=Scytonema sp. NUACC26 TaxID=3140176 RepID=UPI0034DC2868
MPRRIQDSIIVITGASSGIGRATALKFAQQGGTLVLAARREAALQEVAVACEQIGGKAVVVPTDVTNEAAVQNLARQTVEMFGRLDVWVNNAAVTLFARFEEAPSDVFRRVIETNLFGYIHGARAALPQFREQGSGILINVASIVGLGGQPYTSAYVISKHGIRAMAECLRMELHLDKASDIHVCTVLPATIDTPLFQQAANYTGRAPKAMDPVYSAEQVAETITNLVRHPQREVIVGAIGYVMGLQSTLTPDLYEQTMAQQVDQNHLQKKPAAPTEGNLFEPMPEYTNVSGNWKHTGELSGLLPWM